MEKEAIKPQTEEFEQTELKLDQIVSYKPPLAYRPTQFRLTKKIELPELLLSSILAPSIDYRRRGLNFNSTWTLSTQTPKNPKILSNTPLRFIMENELEGPSAKWSQLRALVDEEPSNLVN